MKIWSGSSWTETPVFPIVSRVDSKFLRMSTQPFTSSPICPLPASHIPHICMPTTSINASLWDITYCTYPWHEWPHPILPTTLQGWECFYLHSTHEKRERKEIASSSLIANKWQDSDFNPGSLTVILITSLFRMSNTKLLAICPMCYSLMPLGRSGSGFS